MFWLTIRHSTYSNSVVWQVVVTTPLQYLCSWSLEHHLPEIIKPWDKINNMLQQEQHLQHTTQQIYHHHLHSYPWPTLLQVNWKRSQIHNQMFWILHQQFCHHHLLWSMEKLFECFHISIGSTNVLVNELLDQSHISLLN